MKKFFYSFFAAVALMLAATSCSQEEMVENGTSGNDVEVSFNVDMEGPQASRAIGDGLTVDQLIFAVYDKNGVEIQSLRQPNVAVSNKGAVVKTRLVKGQEYQFVFWAQKSGQSHYTLNTDGELVVNYQNSPANDETRDAFYHHEPTFKVSGSFSKNVTLKRPFAQLNLGTTPEDLAAAATAGVNMAQSSVKVTRAAYGKMDVLTGKVDDEDIVEVSYTLAAIPDASKEDLVIKDSENQFEVDTYEYLASDYFLANTASVLSSIEYTLVDDKGNTINKLTIENAPLQRNWRTNIVGEILTGEGTFNIVIDPIFDADRNYPMDGSDLDIWDGTTTEPTKNDAGEYVIDEASDLAYIWSNPTVKWDNATFLLTKDLSFKNVESRAGDTTPATIQPLFGSVYNTNSTGAMNVTFKGNDHVIRDFIINGEDKWNSLFGVLNGGKVENLTIINADVVSGTTDGYYAAIVVAKTYGKMVFDNVHVKDSYLKGIQKVGALIGFTGDSNDLEVKNCTVEGVTIENHDLQGESGSTGGLIGAIVNGKAIIENSYVKNSTLTLLQKDLSEDKGASRANSEFIGVIRAAKVELVNCGVEGNTYTCTPDTWVAYYAPFVGGNYSGASLTVDGITLDASSVIVRTAAEFQAAVQNKDVKNIYLVGGTTYDEVVYSAGTKTIQSLDANNKGIISGKFIARGDIAFKNVAFKPSANSMAKLGSSGYGSYVDKGYTAIVTVYKVEAIFEGCEFTGLHKDFAACAINYHQEASGKVLKVNNCTFEGTTTAIYSKVLCEITNSTFNLDGGVAVHVWPRADGGSKIMFVGNENIANKEATAVAFLTQSVTYKNVEINVQNNRGFKSFDGYTDENIGTRICFEPYGAGLTFVPGSDRFSVTERGALGVNSELTVYTAEELTNAIKNATADITINFGANITGDAVAQQNKGVNVVINGKNYKYDGEILVKGGSVLKPERTASLTINNVEFITENKTRNVIHSYIDKQYTDERYAHNVTIKNCSFTATGTGDVVAAKFRQADNINIVNCVATGLHSLMWSAGTENITIDGVKVNECKNGVSVEGGTDIDVVNSIINANGTYGYAIRVNGTATTDTYVKNCTFNAAAPILIRKASGTNVLELAGTNTLTAGNANGYQIIVTGSDFEEGKPLTAPTGSITLNGVEGYNVYK